MYFITHSLFCQWLFEIIFSFFGKGILFIVASTICILFSFVRLSRLSCLCSLSVFSKSISAVQRTK